MHVKANVTVINHTKPWVPGVIFSFLQSVADNSVQWKPENREFLSTLVFAAFIWTDRVLNDSFYRKLDRFWQHKKWIYNPQIKNWIS